MGRKYKNPPIVEAVCEFKLTPNTLWDMAVPGLVYEKIKKDFPHRESKDLQEVQITAGPEGLQQQVRTSKRILYLAEDRKTFIQLGDWLLAINVLKPYPTWEEFKPKIDQAFNALAEIIKIEGLQRIGLRYINRIDLPQSVVKLDDYFDFYVFVGSQLPQKLVNFIAGIEVDYEDKRDRCRIQMFPDQSRTTGYSAVMLDIDYFLAQPERIDPDNALDWVEGAHTRLEEIFEGCITDQLRELFQEVK